MGAQILKIPELALSEPEAKKLDAAITEVMRFYTDVELSPVVQAWLNLAMICGVLYGPRWMAYNIRQKSAKVIEGRSNVTPIRPAQTPAPAPAPAPAPVAQAEPKRPHNSGATEAMREWSQWNAQSALISNLE